MPSLNWIYWTKLVATWSMLCKVGSVAMDLVIQFTTKSHKNCPREFKIGPEQVGREWQTYCEARGYWTVTFDAAFPKFQSIHHLFFIKWANHGLFLFIFGLFKQTIQFLQQINVKKCPNVHPVYGAGIWTHDLSTMSCPP